jgi:opacity protein-like surface antigen
MKRVLATATVLLAVACGAPEAAAVEPYVQIETGIMSRDVVEEDSSVEGFTVGGRATSTRLIASVGLNVNGVLTVYAQGGVADLAIDEFNGFDSSFNGAYGGGARLNLLLTPHRDGLRLFVEGSVLRTTAEDRVQAEFGCTAASSCTAATRAQNEFLPRLVEETIEWNEYTVLLGAGGRYGVFGPYGGVRLSKVDAKDRVRAAPDANFAAEFRVDADLREQDNFGIFFGTDFFLDRSGKTALNVEVSLFDQDSFRAAVRRAF